MVHVKGTCSLHFITNTFRVSPHTYKNLFPLRHLATSQYSCVWLIYYILLLRFHSPYFSIYDRRHIRKTNRLNKHSLFFGF